MIFLQSLPGANTTREAIEGIKNSGLDDGFKVLLYCLIGTIIALAGVLYLVWRNGEKRTDQVIEKVPNEVLDVLKEIKAGVDKINSDHALDTKEIKMELQFLNRQLAQVTKQPLP